MNNNGNFKDFFKKLWNSPVGFSSSLALVITLIIESLSRHELFGGLAYLFEYPHFFFINFLIVTAALTLTYFIPKRVFAQFIVSFVFLVMAFVNFVLLFTRTQPFEAVDFSILRTGISIVNIYLSVPEIILCVIGILLALAGIVFLFFKSPKTKPEFRRALITSAVALPMCALFLFLASSTGAIPAVFKDKNYAYDTYGFTYCFGRSIFDRGISEPLEYSEISIDEILSSIGTDETVKPALCPNIIFVQLESFMDPNYFVNLSFEKDPVPNFRSLKENYTSGFLSVPSVGSGTANTEFEVLCGMSLDYFGMGEYPFKTILKNKNCETVSYNLKELGYSTHAFHNHTGTFYDRNVVYKNLGFDTFTPVEYMNSYDVNPLGWVKDFVLHDEIIKALESTDTSDFVFAVSVQGHGKYPSTPVEGEQLIKAEGIENEGLLHQFEYYAYQLHEMDEFIGQLVETLSNYDEKCVLVLYGDHQPSIEYSVDDILPADKHASEYVIWSNFSMNREVKDIESYQLSAYVLSRLGINNGILTKLHQKYMGNEDYQRALEMLEYDMLYGDLIAYGREDPYISPEMKMGIQQVEITDVNRINDVIYVIGSGFTTSSRIYVNERSVDTIYISDGVLIADNTEMRAGDIFCVHQITNDLVDLGASNEYIAEENEKENDVTSINTDAVED